jgi:hypothetical protein
MNKYEGISFETLAKHADEGWSLANTRTAQLREAIQALKGARRMINYPGELADIIECTSYQVLMKVLAWGERMFPEPGESLHDVVPESPELEKLRDHDL